MAKYRDSYRFHALDSFYLPCLIIISSLVHVLTFFAYGWEPGMDFYSYDVAGLQLVSGVFFDTYPLLFRPPVVPIVKNVLYMFFEGWPAVLCVLFHLLGVLTTVLVFRLGSRFRLWVGFIAALVFSLVPDVALAFHSFSSITLFLPLGLFTADRFVLWCKAPSWKSSIVLGALVFLCTAARTEAVIFVPLWFFCGFFAHKKAAQAFLFGLVFMLLYNGLCFFYFSDFGRWSVTSKTGWSLFNRVSRKADEQFSASHGPASRRLYELMRLWVPEKVGAGSLLREKLLSYRPGGYSDTDKAVSYITTASLAERQMYTLNVAQERYGFQEADAIFLSAALETVANAPGRFIGTSIFRFICSLGLFDAPILRHEENLFLRARALRESVVDVRLKPEYGNMFIWRPSPQSGESPFVWERAALMSVFNRIAGHPADAVCLPSVFRLIPNALFEKGGIFNLSNGRGVMSERLYHGLGLETFFAEHYWGLRFGRALLAEGINRLCAGKRQEAQELFTQSLVLDPYNPETYVRMGIVLRLQGMPHEALVYLDKALTLYPGHEDASIQKGLVLMSLERWTDACGSFKTAMDSDPQTGSSKKLFDLCARVLESGTFSAEELSACLDDEFGLVRPDTAVSVVKIPSARMRELCMLSRRALYWLSYISAPFSFSSVWMMRILFVLAILSVVFAADRRLAFALAALFGMVILRALVQAVMDDNFGGRFFLYAYPYMLVCGVCGIEHLLAAGETRADRKEEEEDIRKSTSSIGVDVL